MEFLEGRAGFLWLPRRLYRHSNRRIRKLNGPRSPVDPDDN